MEASPSVRYLCSKHSFICLWVTQHTCTGFNFSRTLFQFFLQCNVWWQLDGYHEIWSINDMAEKEPNAAWKLLPQQQWMRVLCNQFEENAYFNLWSENGIFIAVICLFKPWTEFGIKEMLVAHAASLFSHICWIIKVSILFTPLHVAVSWLRMRFLSYH